MGLGFEVLGLGFEVLGPGFEVLRLGFLVLGLGCVVLGLGFEVLGLGFVKYDAFAFSWALLGPPGAPGAFWVLLGSFVTSWRFQWFPGISRGLLASPRDPPGASGHLLKASGAV